VQVAYPAEDTVKLLPGVYGELCGSHTLGVCKQQATTGAPVSGTISCIFGKLSFDRVDDNGKLEREYTNKVGISGRLFFRDVDAKWSDKEEVTNCGSYAANAHFLIACFICRALLATS
jgi:hypothetical protein